MHTDYAWQPPSGLQQPAAVDDDRRSGDEARAGEVEDRPGDVVRRPDASERGLGGAPLFLLRLDRDRSRRDAADADLRRERAREHARKHRLSGLRGAMGRERRPGLVRRDVLDHDDEAAASRAGAAPPPG